MKTIVVIIAIVVFCSCESSPILAQAKPSPNQKTGDCSINVNGNGNTASLVCDGIDVTLAKQVREILSGTRQNASAAKEMSEKLDQIINHFNQEAIPPVVGMRFVDPPDPLLVIVNQSSVVARDIKWMLALWNMDLPDRDDPLPIPTSSFDWLRPNDESGPEMLFDTPLVAPLLKKGDRLFGSVGVTCPTCSRGRTYIVYIVWGTGGWFAEIDDPKAGTAIIPANFHREFRDKYFELLEAMAPLEKRVAIPPYPSR